MTAPPTPARKPPRRLSKDMKIMIVTQLAMYTKPAEVRDMVEKEFGYRIPTINTIVYYDPTQADVELAKEWIVMFNKTRERFLKEVARVPIMNKAYRAHQLQRIHEKEKERENTVGERDTLKQAAEEEGGVFTNRRELTGAGGKDLPVAQLTVQFVQPSKANVDG
jgi:hypothetical protein